jgi:triphosphoribosyl-dephospho-CoA synthase
MASQRGPEVRQPTGAKRIAAAAQAACLLEATVPKPGNVSRGKDLPGLSYRDLLLSATCIGPAFGRLATKRVGRVILEAIRDTRRRVGTNTNLGIVLLLAPLARAALLRGGGLRVRLRRVLRGLNVADARDAYRAIRLADPGGLGRAPQEDVSGEPRRSLLGCMRLAGRRDAIAREYATGYRATFVCGLKALRAARRRGAPPRRAIIQTFLALLARAPDTHLMRRHGPRAACAVSREARSILANGGALTARGRRLIAALDRRLRSARPPLNPGATADLTAAVLFVALLEGDGQRRSTEAPRLRPRTQQSAARGSARAATSRRRASSRSSAANA